MMEIYVLHVASGMELTVKERLEREGYSSNDVIVPTEERLERCRGEWIKRNRLLMPGYVFVYVDLSIQNYYKIRKVPGVLRFLGSDKPSALSEAERMQLFWLYGEGGVFKPSVIRDCPQGRIEIIDGPLVGHEEAIVKLDRHRRKVKVRMPFAGESLVFNLSVHFV